MKRSSAVGLVLVTTAAAAMTACNGKPTRYCVGAYNQVVDDRECQDGRRTSGGVPHWYYGGARGAVAPGTRLSGGSTSEPAGGFSTPSEGGTARGVIGSAGETATGHAGGVHGGGGGE
ncbi:MAG TPA: hypothetical protein VGE93_25830 [Bryobacteraceae bacterium]